MVISDAGLGTIISKAHQLLTCFLAGGASSGPVKPL